MRRTHFILGIMTLVLIASCGSKDEELFIKKNSKETGLNFKNEVVETDSISLANNYYFYNGAGVTVSDFNNDGFEDVLMIGNHVPSRLYLNQGNLQFEEVTKATGLLNTYWNSGSTFADVNGDNLQDIFICTVGEGEPNLLYINQGIDKNGIPHFKEMAKQYGLSEALISTQAAFLDFDKDNDLDLFVAVNSQLMNDRNETKARNVDEDKFTVDKLYRNNGDNTFTDISEETGIVNEGYSLGVAINDINNDGWPDIYVANDFISNDLVYINDTKGGFIEKANDYLRHTSHNGMGVDIADVNDDGFMDITVMDMLPKSNRRRKLMMAPLNYDLFNYRNDLGYTDQHIKNTLQINQGPDLNGDFQFSEVGTLTGIYSTDWSWAPLWADFDNSSTLDLFITNGYYKDLTDLDFSLGLKEKLRFGSNEYSIKYQTETLNKLRQIKENNFMYKNDGDLNLNEVAEDWGLEETSYSHGSAFADLDNDGDLELIVNNLGHEAFLYENTTINTEKPNEDTYVQFILKGTENNTNGIGVKLHMFYEGKKKTYFHSNVRGYLSSMGSVVHFGLGEASKIDSLIIRWPDDNVQKLVDIPVNRRTEIVYQTGSRLKEQIVEKEYTFQSIEDTLNLEYFHKDNAYVDFKNDPLFLKMYTREGPAIAVSDVNGDTKDDFLLGGASGQNSTLFIQENGGFRKESIIPEEDAMYEDMGMLFFDIDNDDDDDLYVVSGSGENGSVTQLFQDRLYYNENGEFIKSNELPNLGSGGTVRGADYDRDGDIDLFVGGKIVPGKYPSSPKSALLINQNGKLKDGNVEVLDSIGMISDAIWTDFNNDGWIDLIALGEWTEILMFVNENGELKRYTESTLTNTSGWWNSIAAGDYDMDGDIDYLLGNFGLNSYLKADPEHPIRLYYGDFDENGKIDPIISYYHENDEEKLEEFVLHTRDALIDQVVAFKKRFKTYDTFSKAKFSDVLRTSEREKASVLDAKILTSSFLENNGDGTFTLTELPIECQVSPVFGILSEDLNKDGVLDVVLSGNLNTAEPLFGNYDASSGVYMKWNETGFETYNTQESGLFLNENQKSISSLIIDSTKVFIAGANSGKLKSYVDNTNSDIKSEFVKLKTTETHVLITFENGRHTKREFYYGNTFLSQSSRNFELLPNMKEVIFYDSEGGSRKIK